MIRQSALMASVAGLALGVMASAAWAADTCPAYPTGTADKVESKDLESKFGPVPKPKKELRVAYVTKSLNEFWQAVAKGVEDEAAKYNIKVEVQATKDESSLAEQLNLAQTVLSSKPDVLLLSPQSDSNLASVIEAAKADNIPTVILDDSRTEGASSYVGTDQVAIGAAAANFLAKTHPNGGKVAQIEGQAGSANARKRIQGFTTELKSHPNLQLVASQPGNWDQMTAMNATSNILREHPDLVGVYSNNDGMAFGVYEAVNNAGLDAKVSVVGTDGISQAKTSIADGQMKATVAEFPYEEGELGVQVALRLLGCQPIPPWVVSPQAVITADNVKTFPNPPAFKK